MNAFVDMKSKKRYLILALSVVAVMVLTVGLAVSIHRRRVATYELGYKQLKVGDSKTVVLTLMGEPTKVTNCEAAVFPSNRGVAENSFACEEQYWYVVLLKDWVISFNKEGNVISKSSAVSP